MTLRTIEIVIDGQPVAMGYDSLGYHGRVQLDGESFLIHVSLTRCGPSAAVKVSG